MKKPRALAKRAEAAMAALLEFPALPSEAAEPDGLAVDEVVVTTTVAEGTVAVVPFVGTTAPEEVVGKGTDTVPVTFPLPPGN